MAVGDTLDFVVDCKGSLNNDSFDWAPTLTMKTTKWSAEADFAGDKASAPAESLWEKYIHTLLMTNEFTFVD